MSAAIDGGLEFLRGVLALRGYRQQILSADIANASTPGFKAVDLDFRQALAAAGGSSARGGALWLADDPRDFGQMGGQTGGQAVGVPAAAIKYQSGDPVTLDGNSVDLNQEKLRAAENAVQYEAAASFASQFIRMMTVAINGSGTPPANGS